MVQWRDKVMVGQRKILLVCVMLFMLTEECQSVNPSGNQGKDFIFALMEGISPGDTHSIYLQVNAKVPTTVILRSPLISSRTYAVHPGTTTIHLEGTLINQGNSLSDKGIRVTADHPVSIHGVDYEVSNSDGFLVLPVAACSTEYIIASYSPMEKSQFVVTGIEANTQVSVIIKTTNGGLSYKGRIYHNGDTFTETLGYLQSLQIQHDLDLTGTIVKSNKRVSVLSGNQCAFVPAGQQACDFLVEQLLPVDSWTTEFIVPSLATRTKYILRILAGYDNTVITSTGKGSHRLQKGQFIEQEFSSSMPVLISADRPILVVQFSEGTITDGKTGDPFMMLIPGIEQFYADYTFQVPPNFLNSHLNIIIPSQHLTDLRLNSIHVNPVLTSHITVPKVHETFSVLTIDLNTKMYNLTCTNLWVRFGAVLYGFADANSYGFPLGFGQHSTYLATALLDSVNSQCHMMGWDVRINMTLLREGYPGALASDIYMGDNSCKGVEHGELLIFKQSLYDCLTTESSSPDWLSYSNQLVYAFHDPVHPFVIRNYNWSVTLNCRIGRNGTVDGQLIYNNTQGSVIHLNTSSKYDVSLGFYRDPSFTQQISGTPLTVSPGTSVYVKVYTTISDWSIKMRLKDCYTTSYGGSNKHYLIKNGCEADVNTHYLSEATHETKFVFQVFSTSSNRNGQNLHCDAVFCGFVDSFSHCSRSCNP